MLYLHTMLDRTYCEKTLHPSRCLVPFIICLVGAVQDAEVIVEFHPHFDIHISICFDQFVHVIKAVLQIVAGPQLPEVELPLHSESDFTEDSKHANADLGSFESVS